MRKNIVLTLTGSDRVGIVDSVTEILVKFDGNVETSRMARLGGEFAMLMLISIPEEHLGNLEKGVLNLQEQGFQVTTKLTEQSYAQKYAGWLPYQIEVHGADHEGIVHQVAHYLTQRGINIESMDTGIIPAPMSGTLFFSMNAVVLVPPNLPHKEWQAHLDDVADDLNVEITVAAYKGK
jgi:glycine cleavage system transcriptional repressor